MPAPARNINNNLTGQIISIVCEVWGVTRPDLVGRCRRRPLPWARAMLCQYLRIYAGHDTVSCATILHCSPENVVLYSCHYKSYAATFKPFDNRDTEVRRRIKEITKPTKPIKPIEPTRRNSKP